MVCYMIFIILFVLFICFVRYQIRLYHASKFPLSNEEVALLAEVRRADYINRSFRIVPLKASVNPRYRESLDRNGRWDRVSLKYKEILPLLTELLRYKRHEWYVWVLANEFEAKYIWANKGDDNKSCYFTGSIPYLIYLAKENNCNTVIGFHNHPHTKDRYWDLLKPSNTDLKSFNYYADTFNKVGLNYIDGLCSQGRYIVYGQMFSEKYCPVHCSVEEISAQNGLSGSDNRLLHKELRKKKHIKIESVVKR